MVVSTEFKFIFINELNNVVATLDMSHVRLVNYAIFNDSQDQLITAGIDGVFIFDFIYESKYSPKLAA